MGEFFVYILKSSVCLSVLYLFYRLLLSKETFYNFNRIAILGILVVSLALPFCEITIKQQTEVQQTVLTLEQLLMLADKISSEDTATLPAQEITTALWIRVLLFIYMVGVVFFLCRNVYSLLRLLKLIRSSIRCKIHKGIWLISHSEPKYSPFSWMNFIVLPYNDVEEDSNAILIHEMAHIRKRHSIDLLITDVCIIFQWFNPAAWLFKQELQNIHEYQADEAVLDKGINAKQYQLLLIKKAAGTRLYSMANSFNHSKLKKRITMMLKEKSNPWVRLKYLYVLPVAAIAITAFARPEISNELKEISAVKVNDLAGIVEKKNVEIKPEVEDTIVITADELITTGETDKGISKITLKGYRTTGLMTDSVIELTTSISEDEGKEIRLAFEKSDTFIKITEMPKIGGINSPLYVVDGKVEKSLPGNPESIHSISVLKDDRAIEIYGMNARNGVIIVHTKDYHKSKLVGGPVIVVDGKRVDTDISELDPSDIESISVVKFDKMDDDKRSLALLYDAIDAEGLVLMTTKKTAQENTIQVKGTVKDNDGRPVVGASVQVKGTTTGTISDLDGNFILNSPAGSEIVIMYIDMKTVVAKAQPEINIVLKPE